MMREPGKSSVAIGVGFLYAAWKPSRIAGLLPVVAALVACLVVSSFLDVASGSMKRIRVGGSPAFVAVVLAAIGIYGMMASSSARVETASRVAASNQCCACPIHPAISTPCSDAATVKGK